MKHLNSIILLVLFFSLPAEHLFAQNATWYFTFAGRVEHPDEKKGKDVDLEGAICTLTKSGSVVSTQTTTSSGKFSFQLEPNADYVISFTKPGFIVKKFAISTHNVPDDRAQHGFNEWKIEVVIFEQYPGLDYSVTNNPIAKVVFNGSKEVDDFGFDQAYTDQMKGALAKLQQLADQARKKDHDFAAAMTAGDKAFQNKDWAGAKAQYDAASVIKPTEKAPIDKSKECAANIAADLNKGKADADYKAAMSAGDQSLGSKSYDAAKTSYQKALTLKPGDGPATQKLKDVDAAIAKAAADAKANADYTAAMAEGDKAFGTKAWDAAKTAYNKALTAKPNDGPATQKLKDVDTAMSAEKANAKKDADYKAAMADGDKAFGTKGWDAAKAAYNKALGIKPNDPPATQKLKDVDAAIAADKANAKKDADYTAAMAEGDKAFVAKTWDAAKTAYNKALSLKPGDAPATQKLKDVDAAIAADKANAKKDADYTAAMAEGDKAFGTKTWDAAKTAYNKALTLKAGDPPATQKLKDVDAAIAADKANAKKDADYTAAMAEGDKAFGTKTWDAAKAAYNKALTLKAGDPPATQKLKDVDAAIAADKANAKKDADYTAAMAEGDKAFGTKTWDAAKAGYNKALALKPGDGPATQKLKDVDAAISADKANAKKDADYTAAMAEGDKAFGTKTWDAAKTAYNKALSFKPGDAPATQKLKDVDAAIAADKANVKKDADYAAAMADGDKAFGAKTWDAAKTAYNKALVAKPGDAPATQKLKDVDAAIAADKANAKKDADYKTAMAEGDKAFGAKTWEAAKAAYNKALVAKPGDAPATQKLKDVDTAIAAEKSKGQLEADYKAAMADGDKAFGTKTWDAAKTAYNKALVAKPGDAPATQKLKDIDAAIAADKLNGQKEADYKAAMDAGNQNFGTKTWDAAKASYQKALTAKPGDVPATQKLKEVDAAIAADKLNGQKDAEYKAAMDAGNQSFGTKAWDAAKTSYQKALTAKPGDAPATQKLKDVDAAIALEKGLKAKEAQYTAALKKGDDGMKAKKYDDAKAAYTEATGLKPDEQLPKDKLKEIANIQNALLGVEAKNKAYQAAILKADAAFKAKDYNPARTAYTEASGIKPDEAYPKSQLKAIDDAINKDKDAEAKYTAAIQKGSDAFGKKDYAEAKSAYTEASGIKPAEQMPKDKIKECEKFLADALLKEKDAKAKEAQYIAALKKGEDGMKAKKYDVAKAAYTEATGLKPDEQLPKDKLKEIGDLQNALLGAEAKNKAYQAAILKADAAFKTRDYNPAKTSYTEASGIKPDEAYPKNQLKAIEEALNKDAAAAAKYTAAIKAGDDAFNAKDYPKAKTSYTEASSLKSAEQYPKDRIRECDKLIADNLKNGQAETEYKVAIAAGDKAFDAKSWDAAKISFQKASGLKPAEQYPKDKLKLIEDQLKGADAIKVKNAKYTAALVKADAAFKLKKWDDAKAGYTEAQSLKPDEEYPPGRLKEIDEAILRDKQNQDVNGRYFNAMSKGNEALGGKEYAKAKAAFEEALLIKTGDVPAKTKLDQVVALMTKEEKDKAIMGQYNKFIMDGDKAMGKEDYPVAKTNYSEASKLRPEQVYPKDQLAQINILIAGKDKRDAKYKAAIAKGDKLFTTKDFANAKIAYQEASDTKPNDAVAKQKIRDCDDAINKLMVKNGTNQVVPHDVQSTKSLLAQKYGEGIHELPETQEVNCKVLTRIVVHGSEGHKYTQKTYSYGQTYWFKDDDSITQNIFEVETASNH
ncbi:MAG: hypothetical protein ACHQRM_06680 [Bacteroidia bacterium]